MTNQRKLLGKPMRKRIGNGINSGVSLVAYPNIIP